MKKEQWEYLYKEYVEEIRDELVWYTYYREPIPVFAMSTHHILNCLKMDNVQNSQWHLYFTLELEVRARAFEGVDDLYV